MSRATVAKSRADKAGKTTSAPTPAVTHEIVPGKCNDQDWNLLLDHDDGDDYALDLVGEVVDSAMSIIYQNYLQRQLIPYTVTQAKDALLQIIEWQFLSQDEGEMESQFEMDWQEDEEPEPALTDCWAQGSVPRMAAPPTPRSEDLECVEEEPDQRTPSPAKEPEVPEIGGEEESSVPVEEASSVQDSLEDTTAQQKIEPRRRNVKFRPYRGKLKSAGLGNITESLDDAEMRQIWEMMTPLPPKTPDTVILQMPNSCHSIVKSGPEATCTDNSPIMGPTTPPCHLQWYAKLQTGRPPGNRDIMYDEAGQVIGMTKINPGRLPTHRVKTGFQVIDPGVEAAQARLEAMRTGRRTKAPLPAQRKQKTSPRVVHLTSSKVSGNPVVAPPGPQPMGRVKEGVNPLPPPLIEVMDVAPGVIVKEGDRVRKGPKQHPKKADLITTAAHRTLHPVRIKAALPTVMVSELLGQSIPIVKPLGEARPIPPIAPHPPYQSVSGC